MSIIIDIETKPDIKAANAIWDPKSVKLGNTKDQDKINEKIDIEYKKHIDRAAHNTMTAEIVGIGMYHTLSGRKIIKL